MGHKAYDCISAPGEVEQEEVAQTLAPAIEIAYEAETSITANQIANETFDIVSDTAAFEIPCEKIALESSMPLNVINGADIVQGS